MTFKSPWHGIQGYRRRWDLSHGGKESYADKVLSYSPIAYWPLWDAAGAVAEDLVNSPAQDGTYVGPPALQNIIGPDGVNGCPLFDGLNDYVHIFSAAFIAAFAGAQGTVLIWYKPSGAGVWTDGVARNMLTLRANGNNTLHLQKPAINNRLNYQYKAGGVAENHNDFTVAGRTSWMPVAMTWDINAGINGEVKFFLDGAQTGATAIALGVWAGAPANATTCIAAFSTVPANLTDGWLAHCAVWDVALAPADVLEVSTVD